MRSMTKSAVWTAMVLAVSVVTAQATLVVQWTFGQDENLDYAGGTAGTDATLYGNATLNTGPTGLGGTWAQALKNGYYVGDNPDGTGLRPNDGYHAFYGSTTLTAGSFRMVVRSHFDGNPREGGDYREADALFTLGNTYSGGQNVLLYADGFGISLTAASANGTSSAASLNMPGGAGWDSSQWYYMAGSWAPGQPTLFYLREIDVNGPAGSPAAQEATSAALLALDPADSISNLVTLGARFNNSTM
ncbi:MAG: hypothetical protein K9N49_04505, partial [Candidatus Marinimicrobia bacterium]|nr:hypothetical protein [Candidatus Neomarinimicrobiota bacterium]